jgi:hypothetical protein
MFCVIEFMAQKPGSFEFLSGVHDGVAVYKDVSSSLRKSKPDRVGVCRGVSPADDESQLEDSGENDELLDGQVE